MNGRWTPTALRRQPRARELGRLYLIDLQPRHVVATVIGVGHEPYALANLLRAILVCWC